MVVLLASCAYVSAFSKPVIFIALTRIKNMNKQLSNNLLMDNMKIKKCSITCLELPCIECVTNAAAANQLKTAVRSQDAVLLTSPKAAKILVEHCDHADLSRLKLVSLGKGTSAVLLRAGLVPTFESTAPSATGLAASLPADYKQLRMLYPASALADSVLQTQLCARGFNRITRLDVYSTGNPVWSKSQKLLAESADCITFTSPSTVAGWVANSGDTTLPCFVIGEKTRAAAEKHGFTSIIHTQMNFNSGTKTDVIGQMSQRVHNWIARTNI